MTAGMTAGAGGKRSGVWIKFTARPGEQGTLAAHLASLVQSSQAEEGTELYLVSVSPAQPDAVYLLELYRDEAGQAAHNANPLIVAGKARTNQLTAGPPEVLPLTPWGGDESVGRARE